MLELEKKNSNLAEVEVDEVLGLMSHVAAEVPSHDAVPSGIVFLRLRGTLYRVLLHLLRHVRVLDHRLSLAHGCLRGAKPGPVGWWDCHFLVEINSRKVIHLTENENTFHVTAV
uniref:Uncharacterized protein n=1 Tax=Anas zonorhyncha TaxID=75864 RepID=A0A8B9ZWJ6_9AVES